MKCQSLSSLTVEIAFKHRRQAIKNQCWCGVNFPRDLKSSLTVEIAFKHRRQAIKNQCWCGVNFPRDLKSSLTLEIAFKHRKGFCGCSPKLDKDLTAVEEIRLVIFTMFSHRKVQTVSIFIISGFVYCSIFVY